MNSLDDQLRELLGQQSDIESKINDIKAEISDQRYNKVLNKITNMTDIERDTILNSMHHSRNNCSDDNPCNGLNYATGTWRCSKCMMIQILRGEHGGSFDFRLDAEITPTECV